MTDTQTETYLPAKIEAALAVMMGIMTDLAIPFDVRHAVGNGYEALHACRSPETVAAMERKMGLAK